MRKLSVLVALLCALALPAVSLAQSCPNPTPIACGAAVAGNSTTGTNRLTTTGCTSYSMAGREVYYTLSLPAPSPVHIVLTPAASMDAGILVFPQSAWSCVTSTCLGVADSGGDGGVETLDVVLPAGVYYIVIDGYQAADYGTFDLDVQCIECSTEICGDGLDQDCSGADVTCPALAADVTVSCPFTPDTVDTATEGNSNIDDYCYGLGALNGVDWSGPEWITQFAPVVDTGYTVTFDALDMFLLGSYNNAGVPNPDDCLRVFGDSFTTGPGPFSFFVENGQERFVSFDGLNGATGTVSYSVTCYENEACTIGSLTLSCSSQNVAGDSTGGANNINILQGVSEELPAVEGVYTFTSSSASAVTITMTMPANDMSLAVIEDEGAACLPRNLLAFSDVLQDPQETPETVQFLAEANVPYYVVIDGWTTADFGAFTINVTCATPCAEGEIDCGAGCVALPSDPLNCGGCGNDCAAHLTNVATATCVANTCGITTCDTGFGDCDTAPANGCETATSSDPANCGTCGNICGAGFVCSGGSCVEGCPTGQTDCGGSCVDTDTDMAHCGGCDQPCDLANGAETCVVGVCTLGACDAGFGNCDTNQTNGCEQTLDTNAHCGACGNACGALEACIDNGQGVFICSSTCEDADGDTFADEACGGTDCDDGDEEVNPGAAESCNAVDDNCDGTTDEGFDGDGDLYSSCDTVEAADCDDANAAINPGATESCNHVDDDCDGLTDDGFDTDGDGYTTCALPALDCDDTDPDTYPGAVDACGDGKDQDCAGGDPACACQDADGDGYTDAECGGDDCNDTDPAIYPDAFEKCDEIDNNCNTEVDEGTACEKQVEGCGGCSSAGDSASAGLMMLLLFGLAALRRRG